MYTREELIDIRQRADLEASIEGATATWTAACIALAAAADHLDSLTRRIECGEMTACLTTQRAIEARRRAAFLEPK